MEKNMKSFLFTIILAFSASGFAEEVTILDKVREVFDLPEVVSSKTYEFERKRSFRDHSYVSFQGHRLYIPRMSKNSRGARSSRKIGNCILVGEKIYSDHSAKYYYRGRCK